MQKKHHCYLFFWDLFTSPKIYFPMHRSFTHAFYIMSLHLQFIHFLKSICDASLIPTFFPSTLSNNSKRTTNAAFKMSEINAYARNLPTVYSAQASRLHEIPHARVSPNSCLHIIRGISPRLRLEGWSGAGLFGGVPDRWSATLLSNGSMSLKTPSSNPIPKKVGCDSH